MIPKFRAWHKTWEEMCGVEQILFDRGNISDVLLDYENFLVHENIDNIVLMQSTGLFDKNGQEVFVKDIVDYKGRKAVVKWHGSYASFIYIFVDELQKRVADWKPLYLSYYRFEVVGNVYQNPELLEVNHD